MEPKRYLRTLKTYSYIPAALIVLGLIGVFMYQQIYGGQQAQATVAVLDPLTTRPAGYQQAQVTMDSVVHTQALDQLVGARINKSPDWVAGHLSVSVVSTLSGLNVSPLYAIRGTAPTKAQALQLTNVAVEEARSLYIQLNTPDPADVALALAPQVKDAQTRTNAARAALAAFELKYNAIDLTTKIGSQRNLVSSLQLTYYQAQADTAASSVVGSYTTYAAAKARSDTLGAQLTAQNAVLTHLVSLEDQYGQLALALQVADGDLVSLQELQQGQINGQVLPLTADVKIVDGAQIQSQLLWYLLTYSVGLILALLLGASAIYAIALMTKERQTAEVVSSAFGAPILARVPRASAPSGGV
ncbi:MAG TPA: hypothetical protein VFD88_05170 [Clostridia bacterium]|nr:hypothetical protein [Clostridia bacterium]